MKYIPFLRPNLVKSAHFLDSLRAIEESRVYSNYGPLSRRFEERAIAEMFNDVGQCLTVNNATVGLILSISQLKRPGKYALMPSFTFAAAPMAAEWAGLTPFFVDVDPNDWTQAASSVRDALQLLDDDVAVVVPYATFGTNIDLAPFESLRTSAGRVPVVVDAAASFGAMNNGHHFGTGFPDAIVFSFHATKAFGVGEGGLIYSEDGDLIERLRQAGNFGFNETREATQLGLNSKMSEFTAAIALATLDQFPRKVLLRRAIYDSYLDILASAGASAAGWSTQAIVGAVPHQFVPILLPPNQSNADVVARMEQKGIQCRRYFSPACHQQRHLSSCPGLDLSVTEDLARRIVSLPLYEEMTSDDVRRVVESLLA